MGRYSSECRNILGDASKEDIDTAMKLGAGHPMGPIELTDFTGIDTAVNILEGWHKKYPDNPLFNPVPIQKRLLAEENWERRLAKVSTNITSDLMTE